MMQSKYTSLILYVLSGVAMVASHKAEAVTRSCKWATSTVPVYVNEASFEEHGFGGKRGLQSVLNAMLVWSSEGQANIRLVYAGDTTATSRQPGQINVWAEAGGSDCVLAVTVWDEPGGVCDNAGIAIFVNTGAACQFQPIEWMVDAPSSDFQPLSNTLVHEFGHTQGYNDDYMNPNTVMQASASSAPAHHLFDGDIDLLTTGAFGYGQRLNYAIRKMSSANGTVWTGPVSVDGSRTNVRPGIAGSSTEMKVAYVDSTLGGNIVVKNSTDGINWSSELVTSISRIGLDLEKTANAYVLAFVSLAPGRPVRAKKRTGAWQVEVTVSDATTNVPPALAWNSMMSKLVMFFADRDSHRIKFVVSTDEGSTWTNGMFLEGPSSREFMALDGLAAACDGSNNCFLSWPAFSLYGGTAQSVCTARWSLSAFNNVVVGDRSCLKTDTTDGIGVTFAVLGGMPTWSLVRSGRDANQSIAFGLRFTNSVATDWLSGGAFGFKSRVGNSVYYVPKTGRLEALYAGE